MNPTFPAFIKAVTKMSTDMMRGIEYDPKNKQLDQTDGKLFAQKSGPVVAEAEEKEREVRAHLDKLAAEVKARSDEQGFS